MTNASVVTGCCECQVFVNVDAFGPLRGWFTFPKKPAPCAVAIRAGVAPKLRYLGTERPVSVVLEHGDRFIFEEHPAPSDAQSPPPAVLHDRRADFPPRVPDEKPFSLPVFDEARLQQDRRRERRSTCNQEIDILPSNRSIPGGKATLMSCSDRGIGFYTEHRLSPGEQFTVIVRRPFDLLAVFTVRHCTAFDAIFWIGAEFHRFEGNSNDLASAQVIAALCHGAC